MSTRRRHTIAAIVIILVLVFAAVALTANWWLSALARRWVPAVLSDRFDSDVEIRQLSVTAFPRPEIHGEGLVFRKRGRRDVPPLITLARFSAHAGVMDLLAAPRRIRKVRIDGLHIQVPPKSERVEIPGQNKPNKRRHETPVVVDELTSDDAVLEIYPKETGRKPLTFHIHHLTMQHVATDRPAPFKAVLTNPHPKGEIQTEGQFGPWQADDPGQTPLSATYDFEHADLDTIRGISGILSSKGRFAGILERIEVEGTTDTPDFSVDIAGHKAPLHTEFHAIVDGTNGNTLLKPVKARLLDSDILAEGAVVREENADGRRVTLDVTVRDARAADLLKLALKGDAPLTGKMSFRARFDLPPGDRDITGRLRLDGEFGIFDSQFTRLNFREKVQELSRKGKGEPEDEQAGSSISNFQGRFALKDGVMTFPSLRFRVSGASVQLAGTYGLKTGALNFRGNLHLDAPVSKTTTGVKSALLRLVDPLFRAKGGGTSIPIKVEGTRESPKFGLDAGRVLGKH